MKRVAQVIVLAILLVAAGFGATLLTSRDNDVAEQDAIEQAAQEATQTPPPVDELVSAESRLLFAGDIFWGRRIEQLALEQDLQYAWPFSGLDTFGREQYDAWIGNLECPVTDEVVSFSDQADLLKFNCRPEFLTEFKNFFDIVSLANNHTDNVGAINGLTETRERLDTNNLQYFGHYDPAATDEACEIVTVSARLQRESGKTETTRLPVALCGYHGVFKLPTANQIAAITPYAEVLPTFVMPHMGAEYEPSADQIRTDTYRAMVDAGADAVFGGHPHWVQNTEVYEGKLIAYSLGNFIFDQAQSADVRRGALIDATITVPVSDELEEWLALADECTANADNCLELAEEFNLSKYDFSIEYDVVASSNEGFLTVRADEAIQAAVEQRMNWSATKEALGITP